MENNFSYFEYPTQVAFLESEEITDDPQWLGGIAYGEMVICGECGSLIALDDIADIRIMPWVSISEEILGVKKISEILGEEVSD